MSKKTGINPVTIRADSLEDYNFTVSRLWIANETIPDGSHKFNPATRRGPRWEKPTTLFLWKEEVVKQENGMVLDEEDFLKVIVKLKETCNIPIRVWGRAHHVSEKRLCLVLTRDMQNRLIVSLHNEDTIVSTNLSFDKFCEGMEYLFPNGELT
jgi:hypothetical protein